MLGTKTCNRCAIEKPIAQFYKHRSYPDGLQSCCMACHLEACRASRARRSGRPIPGRYKPCSACQVVKPLSAFRRSSSDCDGYKATCAECMCERERLANQLMRRSVIRQPNLLDVCDRSERRADLAEIGGLRGVHEIRSRLAVIRRAKRQIRGSNLSEEMLAELLPA